MHSDNALITKLRICLATRGARGIIGLQRVFKIIDLDRSGTIDIQEFWKAMQDFRVNISQEEARHVFEIFDDNDDGVLQYDELMNNIKGPMSDPRKAVVKRAFNRMDFDKNGFLESDDIKRNYKANQHPEVIKGIKSEEEVMVEFLETFEAYISQNKQVSKRDIRDGKVTLNEFIDYYANVSASIDDDDYFELMITNAWNLNNKNYSKSWGADFSREGFM